jgi:hypothetical protein
MRRVDTSDKYAVKIPEGLSTDFIDDPDFLRPSAGECVAAGVAAAGDGKGSSYEELQDPSNLSDCSAESADFESIFDHQAGRKAGRPRTGGKGRHPG